MISVVDGLTNELLCQVKPQVRPQTRWTIKDLKNAIADATGVHLREQRLLWGQKLLTVDDTMDPIVQGERAAVRLIRVQPHWHSHLDHLARQPFLGLMTQASKPWETKLEEGMQAYAAGEQQLPLQTGSDDKRLEALLADRSFVLAAVQENGAILYHASQELRDDRDVVMCALRENGMAIHFASSRLRADREAVMLAVCQNGMALEFVDPELRCDKEVVEAAVKDNGEAIHFVSHEQRFDQPLALAAVARNPEVMKHLPLLLQKDRSFVLDAVKLNGDVLRFVQPEFARQQDIVRAAQSYWQGLAGKNDVATSPRRAETNLRQLHEDLKRDYHKVMKTGGLHGVRQYP